MQKLAAIIMATLICSAVMLPVRSANGTFADAPSRFDRASAPKIALALGGGGVRGAAHIGVLRVLLREHIPIDYVVGNSMEAIIGGLYCAGVPLDRIQAIL